MKKYLLGFLIAVSVSVNAECKQDDAEIIGHVECHAGLGKYLDKPIIDYTNYENGNTEVTFTNGSTMLYSAQCILILKQQEDTDDNQ